MKFDTPDRRRQVIFSVVAAYAVLAGIWILFADIFIEQLLNITAQMLLARVLKVSLFIIAWCFLLYELLQRTQRHLTVKMAATAHAGGRALILPLMLLAIVIATLTWGEIRHELLDEKAKAVSRLHALADLKTQQVSSWLKERRGDARFIQTDRFIVEAYGRWRDTGDISSREQLLTRLTEFVRHNAFNGVLLLSDNGALLWDSQNRQASIDPALSRAVRQAAEKKQLLDFGPYRNAAGGMSLDFIVPMTPGDGQAPILVLYTDPADVLFPLLQSWPMPSSSGETILFRHDGNDALVLNPLRFRPGAASKLRIPLTETAQPGFRALHDAASGAAIDAIDYRNAEVIGVVRNVPGTPWFLTVKLDRAEIYTDAALDSLWVAIAGVLILIDCFGNSWTLLENF